MPMRIAINGFGRVGRYLARLLAKDKSIQLVAVNDIMSIDEATHLLRYDSVHGPFQAVTSYDSDRFLLNDSQVRYIRQQPSEWDWKALNVDVVVESTGIFTTREYTEHHLQRGATKVVIAAPADDADITVVMGVNHNSIKDHHAIISNASCTTNCLALPIQHIEHDFGIIHGSMTTIHPYTLRQRILDGSHKDLRRARACAMNIVPTPVGAHKTVARVIPSLKGKLHGISYRVPTANSALIDLVCELKKPTTTDELRAILIKGADDCLGYCKNPLVSSDYTGTTFGSIVDEELTLITDETQLRLVAWYDNEASFCNQLLRLLHTLSFHMKS
ncbi:type I glyceraldehyde-3-phosphate dehydrogenase [Pseudodesulfovibrio sp. zrk46]|nr:glyceraldehyde 3-phosphate dehydrogenase NAD-binding domain-containing protein [Pseudodesulfovibrio sp. zrk46]QJB58477.1 type I glyceraldehyde-3-phosphate dehydrogenase [Pseudodesulfovibrio sp. zrk46]